jgi:hypothetical protein
MDSVQATESQPSIDRVHSHPPRDELPPGNHPMLSLARGRKRGISTPSLQ